MVLPTLGCMKGTMRTLVTLEKYKGFIDYVCAKRGHSQNKLQWNKNKTKSMKMTHWRLLQTILF